MAQMAEEERPGDHGPGRCGKMMISERYSSVMPKTPYKKNEQLQVRIEDIGINGEGSSPGSGYKNCSCLMVMGY